MIDSDTTLIRHPAPRSLGAGCRVVTGLVSLLLTAAVAFASPRGEGYAVECLPDNPSFEIGPGLKCNPISGWTVFGNGGLGTGLVSHGTRAAWLYGPFDGTANSSRMRCFAECAGGWSHRLSIDVGHRSNDPLVGSARAFFTVRWRTNGGVVINEQTVQLLNSFAETDVMHTVEADLGPAPGAAVSM